MSYGGAGDGDGGARRADDDDDGGGDDDCGGAVVAFSGGPGALHALPPRGNRASVSPPRTMRLGSSRQT
ncbi:hypothetical protein RRF57_011624 [Xylaria bambusicola]|uniref:Uncharacterized protein n=1 Tax=Xylaria bambusicola TaxID=326684 RepID=A0AAN7ZA55_9PEZI